MENALSHILHLLGVPHLELNARAAVASLLMELVWLPASLRQVLVTTYLESGEFDSAEPEGSTSTSSTLFSMDATGAREQTDLSIDTSDLLSELRRAIEALDTPHADAAGGVERLDSGMILTATARLNLQM